MKKKISIIMPVFNGEKFIRPAIDSVLKQTYKNFELIVIDDLSTDNSEKIIRSFEDNRIKLIRNDSKSGVGGSLNNGLKMADGEYIARMDADDICAYDRIEKQYSFLENNKDIDIVGSSAIIIDEKGAKKRRYERPSNHNSIKWNALFSNPMIHPSIFARKEIFEKFKYDESFANGQDYALWSKLLFQENKRFANINEPLIYYRVHDSSVSQTSIKNKSKEKTVNNSLNNIRRYIDLSPEESAMFVDYFSSTGSVLKNTVNMIKIRQKAKKMFLKNENPNRQEIREINQNMTSGYIFMLKGILKHLLNK